MDLLERLFPNRVRKKDHIWQIQDISFLLFPPKSRIPTFSKTIILATTSTSCIPDGNLYCYPSGPNPPTPENFMIEDGFATSIPETGCKNFCACSEDGTCYVKTGQVDSVRIAPYCNLNGRAFFKVFIQHF